MSQFRKFATATLFATIFAVGLSASAWAVNEPCQIENLIYCQAFDQTGVSQPSQNDVATVYDDFLLTGGQNGYVINSIHWVGERLDGNAPVTGWTVALWDSSGDEGSPGSVLYQAHFDGNGGETFLGNFGGHLAYQYEVDPPSWAVENLTNYWLSVVPDLDLESSWGWSTSAAGDGVSYTDIVGGGRIRLSRDFAFALDGTDNNNPAPEPGTLIMLGTGALGLAGVVRRKLL